MMQAIAERQQAVTMIFSMENSCKQLKRLTICGLTCGYPPYCVDLGEAVQREKGLAILCSASLWSGCIFVERFVGWLLSINIHELL
jgi:hypothetical protein